MSIGRLDSEPRLLSNTTATSTSSGHSTRSRSAQPASHPVGRSTGGSSSASSWVIHRGSSVSARRLTWSAAIATSVSLPIGAFVARRTCRASSAGCHPALQIARMSRSVCRSSSPRTATGSSAPRCCNARSEPGWPPDPGTAATRRSPSTISGEVGSGSPVGTPSCDRSVPSRRGSPRSGLTRPSLRLRRASGAVVLPHRRDCRGALRQRPRSRRVPDFERDRFLGKRQVDHESVGEELTGWVAELAFEGCDERARCCVADGGGGVRDRCACREELEGA